MIIQYVYGYSLKITALVLLCIIVNYRPSCDVSLMQGSGTFLRQRANFPQNYNFFTVKSHIYYVYPLAVSSTGSSPSSDRFLSDHIESLLFCRGLDQVKSSFGAGLVLS